MKKCLSILLVVLIALGTVPVLASDYDGHWAKDAIELLQKGGIISGDSEGNINPDANILRAEFVKIINKTFQYTDKASENFQDVDADAWYAGDMLIAKAKGYVKGDEEGKGNPEQSITRAEVCVILARVLGLDVSKTELTFSDAETIPDWAKGSVAALTAAGYLSGYPDGSFQAEAAITRAEAFTVVGKYLKKVQSNQNNSGDTSSMGTPGIGGGSGGGGGGTSNGGTLSAPTISNMNAQTDQLSFGLVSNASSYEIEITVGTTVMTLQTTQNSIALSDTIDSITQTSDDSSFTVSVRVKAIASKTGYRSSEYSKSVSYIKNYPSVDAPKLTAVNKTVEKKNRVVIQAEGGDNISGFKGSFKVDGVAQASMIYDAGNQMFIIPDTSVIGNGKGTLEVKAVSSKKPDIRDSKYTMIDIADVKIPSDTETGSGTQADPYLLRTAADFDKVRSNPDKHFIVMNDIDLGNYTPIPLFTGSIRSADGMQCVLTVTINATENNAGLFGTVGTSAAAAKISNLTVAGKITSTKLNVGGFAGTWINGSISNCINAANIKVTANTGTVMAGGIIGEAYTGVVAGSSSVKNCMNIGAIETRGNMIGGMIGKSSIAVSGCANTGIVTGTTYVGGIVGLGTGNITNSYNSSVVTATTGGYGGGILGSGAATMRISNCFNTGKVVGDKNERAGGIAGEFYGASKILTIENCYNAGPVERLDGAPMGTPIACITKITGSSFSCSNVYYLDENDTDDSLANTEPVTAADWANPQSAAVQKFLKDSAGASGTAFSFDDSAQLVLIENPYYGEGAYRLFDFNMGLKGISKDGNLNLSWNAITDNSVTGIEITIVDNYHFQTVLEPTLLDASATSYSLAGCKENNNYEISVRLKYGEVYSTSKAFELIARPDNTLEKPVISPIATGSTLVSWGAVENAASYELKVKLGQTEETISVNATSYDLAAWIDQKTASSEEATFTVTVSVRAVAGSTAFESSVFSSEANIVKTYPALALPVANYINKIIGGKNRAAIIVAKDAQAASYSATFMVGTVENNTMIYDQTENTYMIPDTSVIGENEAYVEIKAISTTAGVKNSAPLKVTVKDEKIPVIDTETGDGSEENPYRIRTKDDFELVRNNPAKHFMVMNDIDLGDYEPIPTFTGSIRSADGMQCILTVKINDTTSSCGLFRTVSGSAKISNLTLAGSIASSEDKVGGFAGTLTDGNIDGCINTASITAGADQPGTARKSYVGGIVGYTSATAKGEIKNCMNTGKITSYLSELGGIIGRSYVKITGCANTGTVYNTRGTGIGGIAGLQGAASIENCYNSGTITGSGAKALTAGIAGHAATVTINNCFNTGSITGNSARPAAGILGGTFNIKYIATITNCYNTGEIKTASKKYGIAADIDSDGTTGGILSCTNCYYAEGMEDITSSTSLKLTDFADQSNSNVQKLTDAGFTFDKEKMDYPLLAKPEYFAPDGYTIPIKLDIKATGKFEEGTLTLSWNKVTVPDMKELELTVYDGYNLKTMAKETLAADAVGYTVKNLKKDSYYVISIRVKYTDGSFSDASDTVLFTQQANALAKPVIAPVQTGSTTVSWGAVENAASYLLKVKLGQTEEEISVSALNYDLNSWIDAKAGDATSVTVTVSVKAVAGSAAFTDSVYSDEVTVTKTYSALATPEAETRNKIVDGKNRVVISVTKDPQAASYTGKFMVGSTENNTMIYDADENLFIIPDTSVIGSSNAYIEIKAVSGTQGVRDSAPLTVTVEDTEVPVPDTEPGDGSAQNPYRLRNKTDFELVRNNPSSHFRVMNDIDLGTFTPIPTFTGSIASFGDNQFVLMVNINDATMNCGLFRTVSGSAKISNLILAGSVVSSEANVGGFAGTLTDGTIENCINTASIICGGDAGADRRSYAGGIIGYAGNGAKGEIKNCMNTGNITSYLNEVGGIAGRSYIKITDCANTGTIYNTRGTGVGGIAGLQGASSIENCYNSGTITGAGAKALTAGIAGYGATITIKNCFNTGSIIGNAARSAAGILGGTYNITYTATIINCYNIGTIKTASKKYGIAADNDTSGATGGILSCTNCYYVEGMEDITNSTALQLTEFADSENSFIQNLTNAGYVFDKEKCDYPILNTTKYYNPGEYHVWSYDPSVTGAMNGSSLKLDWTATTDASVQNVVVTVTDGYSLETVVDAKQMGKSDTTLSVPNARSDTTYVVEVTLTYTDGTTSTIKTYLISTAVN